MADCGPLCNSLHGYKQVIYPCVQQQKKVPKHDEADMICFYKHIFRRIHSKKKLYIIVL